ncbi:MAG: hypothetical protein WDZ82_01780 [Candidatus Paceibacterota bacterium]
MAYKTTTDHDEIRSWIEGHGGEPAVISGTTTENNSGTLRFDFSGDPGYRRITWEEFFDQFESGNLAFEYNDNGIDGSPEENFKLVDRDKTPGQPEDMSELPDAGDQEAAQENMYGSSPEGHEPESDEEKGNELLR